MPRKIGWGVLGTASIGEERTFPAMMEARNCNRVAIAGRSGDKARRFAERFGFARSYDTYEALLKDPDVEAVYVPLPNGLHMEWVVRALEAGKHVLCEKPMGGTEAEVRRMFDAAARNGVHLMEAFAYLHSPIVREVKRRVDAGEIGELRVIQAALLYRGYFDQLENVRVSRELLGGACYDVGVYNISLAQYMFGMEPEKVRAFAHFMDSGVDDFSAAMLDFGDGRLASIENGFCTHCAKVSYFRVFGSEGMIDVPIAYNASGTHTFHIMRPDRPDEGCEMYAPNNYQLEIEQFGRVISEGEAPLVTREFSLGVARTLDQLLREIGY